MFALCGWLTQSGGVVGLAVSDALSHRDRQYSRSCGSLHSLTAAVGVAMGAVVGVAVGVAVGAVK